MTVTAGLDLEKIAFYPPGLVLYWRLLRQVVHPDLVAAGNAAVAEFLEAPPRGKRAETALIERLTEGRTSLPLGTGELHFLSHFDLAVQFGELFLSDHYHLPRARVGERPRMIDAGANIGLAVLRMKRQYPKAAITAFEPNPAAAAVARRNIDSFGLGDVELIEAAIGAEDGHLEMHLSPDMPMASSATDRMVRAGLPTVQATVRCIGIAGLLEAPVDFLKIDIEGSEYEVIDRAAPHLDRVSHLFCEFHFGPGLPKRLLSAALARLDAAGFDWILEKAQGHWQRPFTLAAESGKWDASANLWARRTDPAREG